MMIKKMHDVVKLMTIHAAKGLEFPVVFVGGLEETLFPNAMSINTREELEEERRLFYVAITSAKQRLWLSYANARYRFGQLQQNDPSRFLEEISEDYVDKSYAGGATQRQWLEPGRSQGTYAKVILVAAAGMQHNVPKNNMALFLLKNLQKIFIQNLQQTKR